MRKLFLAGACLFLAGVVRAQESVAVAPFESTPVRSTSTPTAETGETLSAPAPRAMTQSWDEYPMVTLARSPLPGAGRPAHVDVVHPEETRAYHAQNAADALSRQAGIQFLPKGSPGYPSEARVRGASAKQTLVLMDGRPVSGATLGPADLAEIPLQQIDHIEVVRGGLSSLYGPNAMASVINVITKRATYEGTPISHVTYENASFSSQAYQLDFGARYKRLDYFFFGDQRWQSGFRSNSDNRQWNMGGNVGVSMGKSGKLLFDAGAYHNEASLPGFRCDDLNDASCPTSTTALPPSQFNNKDEKPASTPWARREVGSNYFRASYLVDIQEKVYVAARAFGQMRETDIDDSLNPQPTYAASFNRKNHSNGGDLELHLPLGFLVGGSFIHDHEDTADRLTPSNSYIARAENWGLFAQETFQWKRLTLIPSGRFDQNSQFGDTFNPNVAALHETTEWLRFSASGGKSFRAPTLEESHYNAALMAEKAWSYDAGFELHSSSRSVKVNYFRSDLKDEILSSTFSAINTASSRRQGAETQINYYVNDWFRHALRYTYQDHVEAAYTPRHTVHYLVVYKPSPAWEIDPTLRYEDSRYSGADRSGTKMGSQVIFDIRFAYAWRQMELFMGVTDVFNKRYVEVPGYPLAGTAAYGGIRLRLWG